MVNARLRKFSPTVDKTAKNRRYRSNHLLAQTLRKGRRLKQVGFEKGSVGMKKGLVAIFCLLVLTFSSLPVAAQTRYRRYDSARRYEQRSGDWRNTRRWDRDRSFWDKHRDKLTTGIGAGGGAVLGAAVGGKKGALIGALLGAGGAALYTYKLRDRNRRYRRY